MLILQSTFRTKRSAFSLQKYNKMHNYYLMLRNLLITNFSTGHTGNRNSEALKVLFYGSDDFSLASLKALNKNRLQVEETFNFPHVVEQLDVVCVKHDNPVKSYANKNGIRIHFWPYTVPQNEYDIGIVVSFGHMIPSKSILSCKFGMINGHPSILPRWRGAAPVIHTILNGDKETGISILEVLPKRFDVGKILLQKEYPVPHRTTAKELENLLAPIAANMILQCLQNLPEYLKNSWSQSTDNVTLAKKIEPSMGKIDWDNQSSDEVDRISRALKGYVPVYTQWQGKQIQLWDIIDPAESRTTKINSFVLYDAFPGCCYFHKKRKLLYVKCKDGWIAFKGVALSGKQKMSSPEFYNGFLSKVPQKQHFFTNSTDEVIK